MTCLAFVMTQPNRESSMKIPSGTDMNVLAPSYPCPLLISIDTIRRQRSFSTGHFRKRKVKSEKLRRQLRTCGIEVEKNKKKPSNDLVSNALFANSFSPAGWIRHLPNTGLAKPEPNTAVSTNSVYRPVVSVHPAGNPPT